MTMLESRPERGTRLAVPRPRVAPRAESISSTSLYAGATRIAGPLAPTGSRVRHRNVLTRREQVVATTLVALNLAAAVAFLAWLVRPGHLPADGAGWLGWLGAGAFGLLVLGESVRLLQNVTLWVFTLKAKDPVPMRAQPGLRVAVLTTIVPSKEPLELVAATLAAMQRIRHNGVLDVWILDEGNDPAVKAAARRLGVRHFSRSGRPEYNQTSGQFRARSKAGNHNAWRAEHEHVYDVVAQMDPDHVPHPDFLERTLGYFADPDVAYVVAPQVYGNLHEGFVQHASAGMAYLFHGIIQRGGNGLGAPLLIGTNHLYRPSAWAQIGGYQDSIIEDHLTSMVMLSTTNPATGRRYRGVYTPDILAVGEGPSSWTDFFNQQKRWAYGVWEILLKHTPRLLPRLRPGQRLAFALLQSFYPTVATTWVIGNLLTLFTLTTGAASTRVDLGTYLALWVPTLVSSLGLLLWLRRFNLVEHERREWGVAGLAGLMATIPVYVAAAGAALCGRRLNYTVTAKGTLASPDRIATFRPHLVWAGVALAGLLGACLLGRTGAGAASVWAAFSLLCVLAPPGAYLRHRTRGAPGITARAGNPAAART